MITGEKMVKSGVLEPWVGMWLSTIVLTPLAYFILIKAANDSKLFNKETFVKLFKKKKVIKEKQLS